MDLRYIKWLVAATIGIGLICCTTPAQRRTRIEYPNCEVSEKASTTDTIILEVNCPGQAPFTKTLHRK